MHVPRKGKSQERVKLLEKFFVRSHSHRPLHSASSLEQSPKLDREMEEADYSLPPPSTMKSRRKHEKTKTTSSSSGLKKNWLYFTASLKESIAYVRAFFIGQAKKITAKNEKEASAADLETAKMQVEATDAAEETKIRLNKSQ